MVTTNLDKCIEFKDGVLHFKRGLYETIIDQEGLCFYGTAEELNPLMESLLGNRVKPLRCTPAPKDYKSQSFFKEDTPLDADNSLIR